VYKNIELTSDNFAKYNTQFPDKRTHVQS